MGEEGGGVLRPARARTAAYEKRPDRTSVPLHAFMTGAMSPRQTGYV